MPLRIDQELEELARENQTAILICVGFDLYYDIRDETHPASAPASGDAAVHADEDVREYKGIPVFHVEDAAPDYLLITARPN